MQCYQVAKCIFCFVVLVLIVFSIHSNEAFAFFYAVAALTTFKEAVYEDPHLVLSNWNTLDSDPCDWNGVSCTATRDHVIKL